MSKTVLLTGASGFLGQYVLRALSARDIKVRIITRKNKAFLFEGSETVESVIYSDDLFTEPYEWWIKAFYDIDICIHMAWYVEHNDYLTSLKNMNCLIGTLCAGKAAAEVGIKKFIGIGTCLEYNLLGNEPLAVDSPLKPETLYAASKVASFNILDSYLKATSTKFSWHRLFYIFGEGENDKKLFSYINKNLSKGIAVNLFNPDFVRDFIHAKEAAKMIVDLSLSNQEGPANICSGIPLTVRGFAENIADLYARRDLLLFGDHKKTTGFNPSFVVGKK
jgi:nucleoside-diphosphate-sugar epimerase